MRLFASSYEKSNISFTKNSMRFEQFFAIWQYFMPFSSEIKGFKRSRETTIALSGFLNSCAAEAKANVFI